MEIEHLDSTGSPVGTGEDHPLPIGGTSNATAIDNFAHDSDSFGAGNPATGATMTPLKNGGNVFIARNTSDVAVVYTFYGASDDTFADAQVLPGSIILAAGDSTPQAGYEVLTQAWPAVRCIHTPAGNPTTGASTMTHCK